MALGMRRQLNVAIRKIAHLSPAESRVYEPGKSIAASPVSLCAHEGDV